MTFPKRNRDKKTMLMLTPSFGWLLHSRPTWSDVNSTNSSIEELRYITVNALGAVGEWVYRRQSVSVLKAGHEMTFLVDSADSFSTAHKTTLRQH